MGEEKKSELLELEYTKKFDYIDKWKKNTRLAGLAISVLGVAGAISSYFFYASIISTIIMGAAAISALVLIIPYAVFGPYNRHRYKPKTFFAGISLFLELAIVAGGSVLLILKGFNPIVLSALIIGLLLLGVQLKGHLNEGKYSSLRNSFFKIGYHNNADKQILRNELKSLREKLESDRKQGKHGGDESVNGNARDIIINFLIRFEHLLEHYDDLSNHETDFSLQILLEGREPSNFNYNSFKKLSDDLFDDAFADASSFMELESRQQDYGDQQSVIDYVSRKLPNYDLHRVMDIYMYKAAEEGDVVDRLSRDHH